MDETRQKAVEVALRRRAGMDPGKAAQVRDRLLVQDDLYTTCQGCGRRRSGTLDTLKQPCECGHGPTR